MRPIRLLIADADGTLLTSEGDLTPRTRQAATRLPPAGVATVVVSPHAPRALVGLTKALDLQTPIAAFDGGMLLRPDLEDVLEQRTIPLAVANEVVDHLQDSHLDMWVYRGLDCFVGRTGPRRA